MSLYRHTILNGTLIRVKRKLIRFWIWSFNRSEEDHLIRMKNRLTALRQEQSILMAAIPEEEDRIKKIKEALQDRGDNTGPAFRDSWSGRIEPQRLKKDVKLSGKKKSNKDKPEPRAPALFEARLPGT